MVDRITSDTSTPPCKGDSEELLLHPRPIVWIVWRLGWLRDQDDLTGRIMLQQARVYPRVRVAAMKTIEGCRSRDVFQLVIVKYTERHLEDFQLIKQRDECEIGLRVQHVKNLKEVSQSCRAVIISRKRSTKKLAKLW